MGVHDGRTDVVSSRLVLACRRSPAQVRFMKRMEHPNLVELQRAFLSKDGSVLYVAGGGGHASNP